MSCRSTAAPMPLLSAFTSAYSSLRSFSASAADFTTASPLRTSESLRAYGAFIAPERTRAAASSTRSRALSGRFRSVIYLTDSLTASSSAASVIVTQ